MESAQKQLEKLTPVIQEIHQEIKQVSTVLLGVPGTDDTGLVGEVKNNRKDIARVKRDLTKLWILLASLGGSGALGTGIWSLLNG